MSGAVVKREADPMANEIQPLASQLAAAYRKRVSRYKCGLELSNSEAVAKAEEPSSLSRLWRVEDFPAEQVTWEALEELNRHSPERALQRWQEIKEAALEELRSGHAAGGVLQGDDPHPLRLARFLAIREELTEGLRPQNGVERQLIDTMAQALGGMFFWQEQLYANAAAVLYEPAEPAAMVDRFNKMFLRTLRALQDLRKAPLAVVVQNAGQVNVGRQQVNVKSREASPRKARRRARGKPGACSCLADRRAVIGESV
jgi:hypothetical protein